MRTALKPPTVTGFRNPTAPVYVGSRRVCRRATAELEVSATGAASDVQVAKALKEWAPTIEAIGHGEQTVLFRKGGIKEPTFRPEARTFLFFPTSFHTDQQLLKPGVAERYAEAMRLEPKSEAVLRLPYVAQVTGAWTTFDPQVLPLLDELHVWTEQFIETRLKWRAKQPITVLELRCWRLKQPLELPVVESLFGCFSWVDLTEQINQREQQAGQLLTAGAAPVLADEEFAVRQRKLRAALRGIQAEPLQLDS